jgi:hypothetical protein
MPNRHNKKTYCHRLTAMDTDIKGKAKENPSATRAATKKIHHQDTK